MKVILIKNVPNLGQSGDIKEVSEGYARNFLLTKGLVRIATEATIKELANLKQQGLKKKERSGKKMKDIAKKVNNLKLIVKAKADEKKTLFGAFSATKIAAELKDRGYDIDAKVIKLDQPIKALGYYDVILDFGAGVSAKIGITVTREE